MTRVDFYFHANDKLDVIIKLLQKAAISGFHTFVYLRDSYLLSKYDQLIWQSRPLSFIPHVLFDHPLAGKTPIVLGADPANIIKFDVLINLEPVIRDYFSRFDRVLEVVTEELEDIELSRDHYRFFKQRGYPIYTHDLKV